MSGMGKHALPEHWTELNAARTEKERCASEITAIKISCITKHGKTKLSDCRECFAKMLDLMQGRYCDETGREWFTTRRAFTYELGALFADAKDGKVDLQIIEQRIESEKEAWYRWVLRTYPEFLAIADSGVDQEELRAMLDDPDKTREQLIEKVWEGVGKPADWSTELDSFAKKVEAAKGDPTELKKLYISQFFKDGTTGETLENAQKYLDEFQTMDSMALVEIIDKIVLDERASKNSQPQRDNHKRRLDELRRAKTAFEQSKLQAKARRQEAQARRAADELYDLPPCTVCGRAVDPKNVLSCTTCQALVHLGSQQKLIVYCSEDCLHRGYDDHAEYHRCIEGERCVGDEDEDMDDVNRSVVCKECLDMKSPEIWCSEQCAYANMHRHQDEKHGVHAPMEDIRSWIVPFKEVMAKTLKEANPGVKFQPVT